MSKLGKTPIAVPDSVKVKIQDSSISVEGPKGKLSWTILPYMKVNHDTGKKAITVSIADESRGNSAFHGTTRSLIANMIKGCSEGFEKKLEVIGEGYNAKSQGKELVMQLGFTHPVKMQVPDGITVTCPSEKVIVVQGANKHDVGQFAAEIKYKRIPDPYKIKGIKYANETIRKKAGKTFVSGS